MASLLAVRSFAQYGTRQSSKVFALSRCFQQTYAARAPSNKPCEPVHTTRIPVVPVFRLAEKFKDRIAVRDCNGDSTYRGIFNSSKQLSQEISTVFSGKRLERVAYLCPNDVSYLIAQWGCWMSGQIAVPLSVNQPSSMLEYCILDSDAKLIITTAEHAEFMSLVAAKTNRQLLVIDESLRESAMKPVEEPTSRLVLTSESFLAGQEIDFYSDSDALIIYTSGTTGSPKGVILTHLNLQAQVNGLIQAWEWTEKDNVLHTLPLNHIHGIVNALMCPLYVGARCIMQPKFDVSQVWSALLSIRVQQSERPNIFMGVPTMYSLLIAEYDKIFAKNPRMKEYVHSVCSQKIRLMISGSSRLPPSVYDRWKDITGHNLLERYGMSETGMVLTNPLRGERKKGFVGTPLPGVEVRIAEQKMGTAYEILVKGTSCGTTVIAPKGQPLVGELLVKGHNVFREYFRRPNQTKKEFTADGWFRTGDTCQYVDGIYQILGRTSVDIIKTGGFKVSALEIEAKLLSHPDIAECAVVGLPDITWGHKIAAVIIPREGREVVLSTLRDWARNHLASYAIPTVLRVVDAIPKNHMGKINKTHLVKEVFPETKEKSEEQANLMKVFE